MIGTDARDPGFGHRVRAARGFADLSQAGLAAEITRRSPLNSVSAATIKRLEAENPNVRGSQRIWSALVSAATRSPISFLEHGYFGVLDSPGAKLLNLVEEYASHQSWRCEHPDHFPWEPDCHCGLTRDLREAGLDERIALDGMMLSSIDKDVKDQPDMA